MGEEEGAASVYAMIANLFTPSAIFIFVNIVIGTIAITSRFANATKTKRDSPTQLVRSPSLLDRVMSFNLGYCKYEPTTTETHCVVDSPRSQEPPSPNPGDPTRKHMTRAPSLLERLKSVKLYRSESIKTEEEGPGPGFEPEIMGIEDSVDEEGVDAKADDFINRFKQQLRLQRLDSILRYREMLKRN